MDITLPTVKIRCQPSKKGFCNVCRERSSYGVYVFNGEDKKLIGRACLTHKSQIISERRENRSRKHGMPKAEKWMGPKGLSAADVLRDDGLRPAFVSGGRAIFRIKKKAR